MTEEKFRAILGKQTPDSEKRRRAHFLVETGFGFAHAERRVRAILRAIAGRSGRTE
jgi:dephospho-CoA kinase